MGGQSDCFQPVEKLKGVTKKIVEICNEYNYPILFSTKTDTTYNVPVTPDLHSFQLSISNLNNIMEDNVSSITDRIKFYDDLKNKGFKVGVRIQPFIPEISELDKIVEIFNDADHYTIEGLKLVPQNIQQNQKILEITGLTKKDFIQRGLLNLDTDIRLYYYKEIIDYFKENGLNFSIADNDLHYISSDYCCCGDNLITNQTTFHNTYLLKTYGANYQLNHVLSELKEYKDCKCNYLFTSNRQEGCITVEDFFKKRFDRNTSPFSPKFNKHYKMNQARLL